MTELTPDQIRKELNRAYVLADENYFSDMREAALITPVAKSDKKMEEIRKNYDNLKNLVTASQTAELKRIAAPVQKAFDLAVEARLAIENATAAEKDILSRIKKFGALASAANDLYKEAAKAREEKKAKEEAEKKEKNRN
jgi:hypothetical protein